MRVWKTPSSSSCSSETKSIPLPENDCKFLPVTLTVNKSAFYGRRFYLPAVLYTWNGWGMEGQGEMWSRWPWGGACGFISLPFIISLPSSSSVWFKEPQLSSPICFSLTYFWVPAIDPQALGLVSLVFRDGRSPLHCGTYPSKLSWYFMSILSDRGILEDARNRTQGMRKMTVTVKVWGLSLLTVALFIVYIWVFVFAGIPHHPYFCNAPIWLGICISSKHKWNVLITNQALIRLTGWLASILLFLVFIYVAECVGIIILVRVLWGI